MPKVSIPIVSDPDAQAFLNAAVITDPTQANAINTLVIDLKGYSIWTKFKAIYPIVGGTASQHKYNLKDPRDLDAAFRLTFATGVTHSSTGMVSNGSSGFANTYFNPSINNLVGSSHLSYYSRTLVNESKIDIGCYNLTNYNQIAISFGGTTYCNPNNALGDIDVTFASNSQGFFIASRTSATAVMGQRNLTQITNTSNEARNAFNIYICALNQTGVTGFYSTKQCAFASIGDGLTNTEAANFYTAVQAFNTTLSRQV